MRERNIPELLAPVGGWQQLKAAVQNGADAVYMGGPLFNARIRAENFRPEEMAEAVLYAHARNVKVYITINTLIRDDELFRAFSYAAELYAMGVDAVILQDMGLARLIRKHLPDLPMHLSTQGTVYNGQAAGIIKELGFSRIVPARELSLQEIRTLTSAFHGGAISCQVEVFIHGALCMCYSGQCQMSRVLGGAGGRSGNRGLCAQPCRLPYTDDEGRISYILSPRDICTLEDIPALCETGVDSFKIEGRLKSPQYVAVVTSIYRKYLDQYRDQGDVKVQSSDMQRLTQIFNRGGFTRGYLVQNPGQELLSGDSPKNQGILAGHVKGVKKGSPLVDVELENQVKISIGDGVEIRGRHITGNVITYRKELPDGTVRIGDIKGRLDRGDPVYKVTDKELMLDAEASYADDFLRKIPVNLHFEASPGKRPQLIMQEGNTKILVSGEHLAERAINRPLDEVRAKHQLSRLGGTVFEAADVSVSIAAGTSIPVAELNRMRREAAEKLLAKKCKIDRQPLTDEMLEQIQIDEGLTEDENLPDMPRLFHVYTRTDLKTLPEAKGLQICVPLELYMEDAFGFSANPSRFLPYILNISRGNLDRYIGENFESICDKVENSGILIGNPGWIAQFRDAGIRVYGDYGLNVYNRQAQMAYEALGVEVKGWSHEAEQHLFRNIPLMITEHPVLSKEITDRKGKKYTIVRSASGDKYMIFSMSS